MKIRMPGIWARLIVMVGLIAAVDVEAGYETLYTSPNLSGHEVFAECNPGRSEQPCECSPDDVGLLTVEEYGEVISNIRQRPTYVNAIGYQKFTDTFPDGRTVMLGVYKYTARVRLPHTHQAKCNSLFVLTFRGMYETISESKTYYDHEQTSLSNEGGQYHDHQDRRDE